VKLAEIRVKSQFTQAWAGLEAAEAALQQVQDLAEIRTKTQIQQAKASLDALQANLEKIRRGARDEEREQVKATVAQAEAGLANAQSNYNRMKQLYDAGAISRQTFESVETQLEVSKAQSQTAKEQLNMVEKGARKEDIQAMEAQVKQAEAVFKLAERQAEKLTWEKDIAMAQAQTKQAEAALKAAEILVEAKSWEAEITAAETQLIQAKVAYDLARKQLANAYVKAPFKGIVSQRHMDTGGMANPAAPVFDLVDMDEVHANADVLEADLSKIRTGAAAWIQVSVLGEKVKGRVTSISPTVEEMTRTAKVEITVDNANHVLKPGMFAQVYIPTDVRTSAVLLPRSAVMEDESTNKKYVFVADMGRSRKAVVEYGLTEGNMVEIVKGLNMGDQVIIAGQQNLQDGDFVNIVKVVESL
jgi:RND family efflux transporter MFP subunit